MNDIETSELRCVRGSGAEAVVAVDRVDLAVARGEIVGLLGPNGAGKTTLLRMLVTLLRPTGGRATVVGRDLSRDPRAIRRRIGYVAQGGGSDPTVTGRAELVHQARAHRLDRRAAAARADELLGRFALHDCADRPTGTWSGGQRRRLDLALAFVHRPALVFLDEPSTALDPQSRARLWDEIRALRADGTTVLLTTHYLDEADALCDRVAIIDHGRVVADGRPDDLKARTAGEAILVGTETHGSGAVTDAVAALLGRQPFARSVATVPGGVRVQVDGDGAAAALPAILRLLDDAGHPPASLTLTRPSLDDVFFAHTGRSLRAAA
jgi:ABC-2 type transport system ATP-binding protein